MTEKAQATKETNISIGHYQNLSFCVKFKTIKRVKRQSTEWDKVFANPLRDEYPENTKNS